MFVVETGACTAVGRDAHASVAAVRAGLTGFTEHPFIVDTAGRPVKMALAPWIDPDCPVAERCEALLLPALQQCADAWPVDSRLALAVALPAPRPGLPDDLAAALRRRIVERLGDRIAAIATFPNGHAAGVLALQAVGRKLREGLFGACIVAGVESYASADTLEWLEAEEQLHGAGRLNNAWGFVPGEAAAAVLVCSEQGASQLPVPPAVVTRGIGHAMEANRIKTRTVCTGEGLTAAFRQALDGLSGGARITDVYCDMNGEPYRADEFGFACLRTKEFFQSASDFRAAADCWGDVSAASVPLGIAQAVQAGIRGYANGAHALVWASSETGDRGAVVLETPWSATAA